MNPTDSLPLGQPDPLGSVIHLVQLADYSWETIHNPPSAPTSRGTLYLSEALPESAAQQSAALGFHVPSSFFSAHQKSTVAEWDVPFLDPETNIFAKWTSPATQLGKQWDIEQRIAANRPYDVDTVQDPSELRLNHLRYERDPPLPVRPYHPISSFEDGENDMVHATTECVSLHWEYNEGVKTGTRMPWWGVGMRDLLLFEVFNLIFLFLHRLLTFRSSSISSDNEQEIRLLGRRRWPRCCYPRNRVFRQADVPREVPRQDDYDGCLSQSGV